MGLNIHAILAQLDRVKTAEEVFADGLKDTEVVEQTPETVEQTPEVVEPSVIEEEPTEKTAEDAEAVKLAELQKEAQELDEKGRVMARAFMNELEKIANELYSEEGSEVIEEDVEKVAENDPRAYILTQIYNNIY